MACEGILTADILFDCDNPSIQGLETDLLLINQAEINKTASTIDGTNKLKMTLLQLIAGSGYTAFLLKGIKQINSASFELVKKETGPDKFKHILNAMILTPSVANKLQLQNMSEGQKYVAVVHKKWKGASNLEAFEVLGYDSGLELNVATGSTAENDGSIPFELSSADNYEEPKLPLTLVMTDYDTTLAAFNNKFLEA